MAAKLEILRSEGIYCTISLCIVATLDVCHFVGRSKYYAKSVLTMNASSIVPITTELLVTFGVAMYFSYVDTLSCWGLNWGTHTPMTFGCSLKKIIFP